MSNETVVGAQFAFTRKDSQMVKGVAILLMILHHALLPGFYDEPSEVLGHMVITRLMIGGKFCVGLFTFIIGYGYAFASNHGWNYSLKHIGRLLIRYWLLLFCIFIPLSFMCDGGGQIFTSGNIVEYVRFTFWL